MPRTLFPRSLRALPTRRAAACAALCAALLAACGEAPAPRSSRAPIPPLVLGLADEALDARERGAVLLGELGCASCHAAPGAAAIDARSGPSLAGVGTRVRAPYLERFLADPHALDPGTTMPQLLADHDDAERERAAAALAAYLRSIAESPSAPGPTTSATDAPEPPSMEAAAERGRALFFRIGCVHCHAPLDPSADRPALAGTLPLANVAAKYAPEALRAFLLAPHELRPSGRMPDFHLAPGEASDLASYLQRGAPASEAPHAPDPRAIDEGRRLFTERRCDACHALPDPARPAAPSAAPLAALANHAAGCLEEARGPWPNYELTTAQRDDLAAALRALGEPVSDAQRTQRLLASGSCTACHARDGVGAPSAEALRLFGTGDPNLGEEGRLPPPLTLVGAKLEPAWLEETIAHGQALRPYLHARMPGFGVALARELTPLLAAQDELPPLELPEPVEERERLRELRDLGRELAGDRGMSCISCHAFAGSAVGAMQALDLLDTTGRRLQRLWFHHYLREPLRFHPRTVMPQFFANGVSTRPELGGGEVTRQIDALWHYLAEGRNARSPSGLRPPPVELVVGDEAVVLRRSAPEVGKRAINVGYPGGVNLAFDAESLALRRIWWGRFVDASGVFHGQGSGEVRPLGEPRVLLPRGPAFAVLSSADEAWPTATRRELGQAWLGYDFASAQRPVFRYRVAGLEIEDEAEVRAAPAPTALPVLRRTLRVRGELAGEQRLFFLAARDARVEPREDGAFQIGEALRLSISGARAHLRGADAERELLLELELGAGRAELVLDYASGGEPK